MGLFEAERFQVSSMEGFKFATMEPQCSSSSTLNPPVCSFGADNISVTNLHLCNVPGG